MMNYKYLSIGLGITSVLLLAILVRLLTNVGDIERYTTIEQSPSQLEQQNEMNEEVGVEENTPMIVDGQVVPETPRPKSNTIDPKVIPWKLTKGDVTDTCTGPTFAGQVTLKGRYVWDTSYVENQWLLEISPDQLKLLPIAQLKLQDFYKDKTVFYLQNVSSELEADLKRATDFDPKEVTITSFSQYCEGTATLTVK